MLSVGRLEVAGALPLGPIQISVADLLWFLVGVAAMVAVAFFWGGINPATLIGRLLGRDVTRAGSGNPGATNAGRVLGRKWGILVGVLDVLKGFLPAFLAAQFYGVLVGYLLGIAAVLGHVFSPYLRGRGGKGVATALGAILGVHPWYAVVLLLVFVVVFALSRWVALGSLVAAGVMLVGGALAASGNLPGAAGLPTTIWAWVLGLIILARHRGNIIARLRALGRLD